MENDLPVSLFLVSLIMDSNLTFLIRTCNPISVLLISRFPFYYELKIIFLIWLISPVSRGSLGSSLLYRKLVHPNLMKREDEIDRWMGRVQVGL